MSHFSSKSSTWNVMNVTYVHSLQVREGHIQCQCLTVFIQLKIHIFTKTDSQNSVAANALTYKWVDVGHPPSNRLRQQRIIKADKRRVYHSNLRPYHKNEIINTTHIDSTFWSVLQRSNFKTLLINLCCNNKIPWT